jgi:putative membrane protein
MFLYIKSLHIIFVITWFAGLFYMPRLFIYSVEANEKPEPNRSILLEQNLLMQQRLWYIITWPSAIITLILAAILLIQNPVFLQHSWMHLKLSFVFLLYGYHFFCHYIYKQQQKEIFKYSSKQLRIWNELATILLFIIVFLVVVKSQLSVLYAILGVVVLSIILMLGIKFYALVRKK